MNLLRMAQRLVRPVTVKWSRTTGRTQNTKGQWITAYDEPVDLVCNFQPIEKGKYELLGLDMKKRYFILYGSDDLIAVERNTGGDVIDFNGTRYQFEDAIDWYFYDGWRGVICVDIGPTPVAP